MNFKNREAEQFVDLDIESRRFEQEQEALVEVAKRAEWCTGD
jgi:hypothetical protein